MIDKKQPKPKLKAEFQPSSGRRKQPAKEKDKAERRTTPKPRRKSKPKADKELYQLPKSDIKEFIATERRHDELDRVREVQEQKRTWNRTVAACVFLNLVFVALAIIGTMLK